jgi:hypothetical protein
MQVSRISSLRLLMLTPSTKDSRSRGSRRHFCGRPSRAGRYKRDFSNDTIYFIPSEFPLRCKTRSVPLEQHIWTKRTIIYSFRLMPTGNLSTRRIVDMLLLPFLYRHLRVSMANSLTGIRKNVKHIEMILYKVKGTLRYSVKRLLCFDRSSDRFENHSVTDRYK